MSECVCKLAEASSAGADCMLVPGGRWSAMIMRGLVLRAGGVGCVLERDKGVRWMPWRQEAMKDVARCEKPRGDASDR